MKSILSYLIVLSLSVLCFAWDSPHFSKLEEIEAVQFTGDSGYILKPEAEKLLYNILPDSSRLTYSIEDDTIGKYFKTSQGNYFTCIAIPGEAVHIVAEINPIGKVIRHELFGLGRHHCCWDNAYEGFKKHGKYFSIKTCGTGSGFCSSELYIFDTLIAQDQQNSILKYFWSSTCVGKYSSNFYSDMEIRNDTIFMHYTSEKGVLKKRFKIRKTEQFDLFFTGKNSKWIASDTTKFDDYQY